MKRLVVLLSGLAIAILTKPILAYTTWPGYYTPPKWINTDIVEYEINQNGTSDCEGEFDALHRSFQTWEDISTCSLDFHSIGLTPYMPVAAYPDGYNTIGWVQSGWDALDTSFKPNMMAASIVWVNTSGEIVECDMFFNGEYYTWSAQLEGCPYNKADVQNVATHEAGHWHGLHHVLDTEPTMYGEISKGETKKRDLHSDDIAGASFLYHYEVDWPDEMNAISAAYHHFSADVALAWDPTDKDEYLHIACEEGLYTTAYEDSNPPVDTFSPLDSIIWPVRVVYVHNEMGGWSLKE